MARVVPPDLVITDVVMAGMSGIDLAIVMHELVPDCRILLFSGQAATADLLATARRDGHTFAVLAKPVHPHDLLEQASRVISNRYTDSGVSCRRCN